LLLSTINDTKYNIFRPELITKLIDLAVQKKSIDDKKISEVQSYMETKNLCLRNSNGKKRTINQISNAIIKLVENRSIKIKNQLLIDDFEQHINNNVLDSILGKKIIKK